MESFQSDIWDSKGGQDTKVGNLRTEEQRQHIDSASIEPSSERLPEKEYIAQHVSGQHSSQEKTISTQPRTPPGSPRKKRRFNAHAEPKPSIPHRRSSVPVRRKGQDLIAFHRQSCRLFQSLEGTLASSHKSITESTSPRSIHSSTPTSQPSSSCIIKTENGFAYLSTTTSPPRFGSVRSSRTNSSAVTSPLHSPYDISCPTTTSSSSFSSLAGTSTSILEEKFISPLNSASILERRPHPVSVMSWTSVESRRAEYEKIDRSNSGVRGMWKKITPRWCRPRCARRAFFDGREDRSRAGSVRRFRMALDDDDDDDDDDADEVEDFKEQLGREVREKEKKIRRWGTWSCLPFVN